MSLMIVFGVASAWVLHLLPLETYVTVFVVCVTDILFPSYTHFQDLLADLLPRRSVHVARASISVEVWRQWRGWALNPHLAGETAYQELWFVLKTVVADDTSVIKYFMLVYITSITAEYKANKSNSRCTSHLLTYWNVCLQLQAAHSWLMRSFAALSVFSASISSNQRVSWTVVFW